MTTMTIHADDKFAAALRAYAENMGKSVNQTVKDLLSPILGVAQEETSHPVNRWARYWGCCPKSETAAVRKAVAEQHVVDKELWK